ncbi:helix-turn-helix transcriptional regulator [Verrucomicrobiota bacterium]
MDKEERGIGPEQGKRPDLGLQEGRAYDGEHLISVAQVAGLLGVCTRTVHRLIAAGELQPPVKVGRASRWFWSDVQGYLDRLRQIRGRQYAAPEQVQGATQ